LHDGCLFKALIVGKWVGPHEDIRRLLKFVFTAGVLYSPLCNGVHLEVSNCPSRLAAFQTTSKKERNKNRATAIIMTSVAQANTVVARAAASFPAEIKGTEAVPLTGIFEPERVEDPNGTKLRLPKKPVRVTMYATHRSEY
jgi:hypothetical protein